MRTHLVESCSPEQIAGRRRPTYPDSMRKQLGREGQTTVASFPIGRRSRRVPPRWQPARCPVTGRAT
ncbi:hypothetical protein COMA2_100176 [Candidatus Nitrospira nitrificans]|uniref:Uncharacterized protein n=1 Tax=Candidatus Nitrospira nitrificans TaxID=1742973 RepID=A0A0S4LBN3_9BACT|nr:hypothetical protein COMA2_100176 [Candidatus Nitrospira nitrificans]